MNIHDFEQMVLNFVEIRHEVAYCCIYTPLVVEALHCSNYSYVFPLTVSHSRYRRVSILLYRVEASLEAD